VSCKLIPSERDLASCPNVRYVQHAPARFPVSFVGFRVEGPKSLVGLGGEHFFERGHSFLRLSTFLSLPIRSSQIVRGKIAGRRPLATVSFRPAGR